MNSFMKSSIVISLLTMSLSLPANDLIDKRYVDNQDGTITDLRTNLHGSVVAKVKAGQAVLVSVMQ